jgi:uncharacterized protein YegL
MPSLDSIRDEDLIRNKEQRSPCILLLDTSASMRGSPIQELNDGLKLFEEEVKKDPLAAVRCEIAIVSFGGVAQMVQDFVTADEFTAPVLDAAGDTPMGAAINLSLDSLRQRKSSYQKRELHSSRVFVISDGADDEGRRRLEAPEEERNKGVIVPPSASGAALNVLQQLSTELSLGSRPEVQEFFVWLHEPASVGRQAGGQAQLPSLRVV